MLFDAVTNNLRSSIDKHIDSHKTDEDIENELDE